MPCTNFRWNTMNTTIIGRVAITDPANSRFQDVSFLTTKSASPRGALYSPGPHMMISGQRKSSHAPWKVKIAVAARAGTHSGITTRQKTCHSLAPSTRAACSSSSGIDCMYCRSRKIPKA